LLAYPVIILSKEVARVFAVRAKEVDVELRNTLHFVVRHTQGSLDGRWGAKEAEKNCDLLLGKEALNDRQRQYTKEKTAPGSNVRERWFEEPG
jgi:hypothetical protein